MVTQFVAQVMTRGMVKSKLIYESKWVIRSQAPYNELRCAVHRLEVGWLIYNISLRYSQASFERMQGINIL